jgi:glycosyltransferase involved in cell wall biosynthesis/2-polyprenyl-3-methyl-5-hydroxy-6-metoxy-1,4-benzoquinol methylase
MNEKQIFQVTVLDMQPIDPPIGGGRLRLLGLYHGMGEYLPTTYIGSYDWPGENYRHHRLSKTLEEIDIPLSDQHFYECAEWQSRLGGKTIIDSCFNLLGHHSSQFVETARSKVAESDIVIFSHPWVYPLVKDLLRSRPQLVVYDSQNVEGLLRTSLLDDGNFGTEIAKNVVRIEYELCQNCDLILACSHEDRELFHKLYNIPFSKIAIVPNGVFTDKIQNLSDSKRGTARKKLNIGNSPLVIFMGSSYVPNTEAARFIIDKLAREMPDVKFAICGGVGDQFSQEELSEKNITNVILTGFLKESEKLDYLAASDLAINPMFSGSGTNIKMFDFMAAGLPVISTPIGARGIFQGSETAIHICTAEEFTSSIQQVINDKNYNQVLGKSARSLVERKYAWQRISNNLGLLLHRNRLKLSDNIPFFSVIIPTYERHDKLELLLDCLQNQTFQEFEIIIVDQSKKSWTQTEKYSNLDITYIHSDIKGAVIARNRASYYARGKVLAFTDDDCQPKPDWLENSITYFENNDVVGVEGLIISDKLKDDNYRSVTNLGFEGIGFMTANLLVRREVFMAVDGFDESFDNPHFREDTDLGWRICQHGQVIFAEDVCVFHPPHLRTDQGESLEERNQFFEKDVLLMQKHPERYRELFFMESHYKNTPGFRENFIRGIKKYNVEVDKFYLDILAVDDAMMKFETQFSETIPDLFSGNRKNLNSLRINNIEKEKEEVSQDQDIALVEQILLHSQISSLLSTNIPQTIQAHLKSAEILLNKVKDIVGIQSHGDYFKASVPRYLHYLAAAMTLKKKSRILDVGSAPGHIGIGLHLLGMKVVGVNLNEAWRETYPSLDWVEKLGVIERNLEQEILPYDDNVFDAVYFTEVLEHIAIKNPVEILSDLRRVLKTDGLLILSTPNICNISNIYALLNECNIFWQPEIFYGSLDRHNREYTPKEVYNLVEKSGFKDIQIYGINSYCNWRSGTDDYPYKIINALGDNHPLLRNTIIVLAKK